MAGVSLDHVVTVSPAPLTLEVTAATPAMFEAVMFRVDGGPWEPLDERESAWQSEVAVEHLEAGSHTLEVMAVDKSGQKQKVEASFRVRS